jgi:LysR family glycine cleavage system transcriptional activator
MPLRLPPLGPLRLFEAAGRHLSFKLAAQELGVTPSAVSHGIDTLEEFLGTRLFDRGPRGLSLTAAGRDYLPYVSDALAGIAIATQRLPDHRSARDVSISCTQAFASRLLIPALRLFQQQHPQVSVSLDTSRRQVGFTADGFDLAIRMGRGPWPGLYSEKLVTEYLVPVCAPALEKTLPSGAERFARASLLHVTSVTEDWSFWLQEAGVDGVDLAGGLRFDGIQLVFDAAREGLGIAIGRKPLIDPELSRGDLVPASDIVVESGVGYWLVSPDAIDERSPAALLRRWLAAHFSDNAHRERKKLTRG